MRAQYFGQLGCGPHLSFSGVVGGDDTLGQRRSEATLREQSPEQERTEHVGPRGLIGSPKAALEPGGAAVWCVGAAARATPMRPADHAYFNTRGV